MHLAKAITTLAVLALATLSTKTNASPIPSSPGMAASESHFSERAIEINDWNCKPSVRHPNPVVLVHGTGANSWDNWLYYRPRLALEGYCTFALSYGQMNGLPMFYGLDKMENSAAQLATFIDKGHSQGSVMPRYYLKYLGGGPKVRKFAGIGSVQYGSSLWNLVPYLQSIGLYDPIKKLINPLCLSCTQFAAGSSFLNDLNASGDTVPGVEYLMITSKLEELVVPYTNGFLRDKNPLVHNMVLQDLCPLDISEHAAQAFE
ncbi:hypothetical protein BG000_009065 [Podila horticola]|nr:hypothetical protein BG000_009065 [Podila horticola]